MIRMVGHCAKDFSCFVAALTVLVTSCHDISLSFSELNENEVPTQVAILTNLKTSWTQFSKVCILDEGSSAYLPKTLMSNWKIK